MKFCSRLFFI